MNVVQPIRDREKLSDIAEFLRSKNERNYMLFYFGLNTGLRIYDILKLRVKDVQGHHISMRERKTKKQKRLRITPELYRELQRYIANMNEEDYLFQSRKGKNRPISRVTAYRILNEAAKEFGLKEIGCHTMRKTFGYHFYHDTKDVAMLQKLFNHSDQTTTLIYIGVDQDAQDNAMKRFKIFK